ncbi:MAG: hypothetical protein FWB91_12610 [Defluviitaleaceae bacterium]|nr:hypothetical protein [Defluviitaleaceae bacterium]
MKNITKNSFGTVLMGGILCVFMLSLLTACGNTQRATELGRNFNQSIYNAVAENGVIDFNNIADFEWEYLIIISPYSIVSRVLDSEGLNWRNPVTHIESSDVNVLLLFSYENNVVAFSHFSRYNIDFVQVVTQYEKTVFNRNEAQFEFNNAVDNNEL